MAGYSVTGLSTYVENNKDTLIKDIVLGYEKGDSVSRMAKQLGIKSKEKVNFLDIEAVLQDGSNCGFSAVGSTVFSEREIEVKPVKANDEFCNKDLLGKYAEYLVRMGANANAEEFAFESEIIDGVVRSVRKQIEEIVWQGSTGLSITGLIGLAENADSASTIFTTGSTSASTIYERVKKVIMALPEYLLDKAFVAVSAANFRKLVFELLEDKNMKMPAEAIEAGQFYFPGTTIPVIKVAGLSGVDKIYASVWENLVFGTDMLNDSESIRWWFSDDNDTHRYKLSFSLGIMTRFPDAVVLDKIAE